MSQLSHGGLSKKQRKARTAFRLSLLMMILLLMMLLQMVIMIMIMAVMTNRELDKGRVTLPNRMNLRNSSRGGRGPFSIQKIALQILDLYKGLFWTFSEKNAI